MPNMKMNTYNSNSISNRLIVSFIIISQMETGSLRAYLLVLCLFCSGLTFLFHIRETAYSNVQTVNPPFIPLYKRATSQEYIHLNLIKSR